MDCLFTDSEAKEILIYAKELQARSLHPILYISPDFNLINSSIVTLSGITPSDAKIDWTIHGYSGTYYGMPIYVFDGIESHCCCVIPECPVHSF